MISQTESLLRTEARETAQDRQSYKQCIHKTAYRPPTRSQGYLGRFTGYLNFHTPTLLEEPCKQYQ